MRSTRFDEYGLGRRRVGRVRPRRATRATVIAGLAALGLVAGDACAAEEADTSVLKAMSMAELMDIEVTSVSKHAESLAEAPASIYVIAADEIRRSGATTLPEALRLAPNLHVARVGALQYAVSARGFNNAIGNKLLVLVDGRTIYTPLFSGVFWDQQDLLLEDVERIEVISGPGATLWGANAVNGVINVITRSAADTQGVLLSAGDGPHESNAAFRYGAALGSTGHFRVYGKASTFESTENAAGVPARNNRNRAQVGFRADWRLPGTEITLQGDAYHGQSDHRGFVGAIEIPPVRVSGANLLGRWTRRFADGSHVRVQAYFDQSEREEIVLFQPKSRTFDVEFQHGFAVGDHRILWGGGYRHARDDVDPGALASFIPSSRSLAWANVFVQDEIRLSDELKVIPGLKLERNDYTGIEHLPSVRFAWTPADGALLWGAVSRAVRAPSRFDRDVFFPTAPPFIVRGGPNFKSEIAHVFELGYRAQPTNTISYSVTGFYHLWDDLRSGTAVPVELENRISGESFGIETWGTVRVTPRWRLRAGMFAMRKNLELETGSTDPVGVDNPTLSNDPEFQWMLRSSFDLSASTNLDVALRRVGPLPHPKVPGYTALDGRIAWRPAPDLELSLTGRNLLDAHHVEFGDVPGRSVIDRTVYLQLRWEH